jgi:hypothetical protein
LTKALLSGLSAVQYMKYLSTLISVPAISLVTALNGNQLLLKDI